MIPFYKPKPNPLHPHTHPKTPSALTTSPSQPRPTLAHAPTNPPAPKKLSILHSWYPPHPITRLPPPGTLCHAPSSPLVCPAAPSPRLSPPRARSLPSPFGAFPAPRPSPSRSPTSQSTTPSLAPWNRGVPISRRWSCPAQSEWVAARRPRRDQATRRGDGEEDREGERGFVSRLEGRVKVE